MAELNKITLRRPDDWHVHLRDGAMLKAVVPYTARTFARAIVMPNLTPPITTWAMARDYRDRIREAVPAGMNFTPLMTLYLTDHTDVKDLQEGHKGGFYTAAKLYPAHATTSSAHGVTAIKNIYPALEAMQKIGMPLLVHGEATDPSIDIFDREKVFLENTLPGILKDFPSLRVVLEHITTSDAVEFVKRVSQKHSLGATITAHHLHINRTAVFKGGIRPHFYCLPIAKREEHRLAVVKAATSGLPCFFLGTDSAPHAASAKESGCGCAGIFTAPNALELYAEIFARENALDKLEAFASLNGARFYGLAPNTETVTLVSESAAPIAPVKLDAGDKIIPFEAEMKPRWSVVRG